MNTRVTVPLALFEKMAKIFSLYEMGMLVPAPPGSPIKMPPRDPNLPPARMEEPEPVATSSTEAPEKLPDTPTIPAVGLSSQFRPTAGTFAEEEFLAANPRAREKKDAAHDRHRDSPEGR